MELALSPCRYAWKRHLEAPFQSAPSTPQSICMGDRMSNRNWNFAFPPFRRLHDLSIACWIFFVCAMLFISQTPSLMAKQTSSTDWTHWRGPSMDGMSTETNLPDSWSLEGENLIWKKEQFASRSSPVVMNGRIYLVCRAFPETTREGEKTICVDAVTGELIWESIHNVYLSDAPAERVGWSSVVGDPETDRVYVLGLGCVFQCLDGKTGAIVWQHSMSEEYGMLSTYGGRTNFPVVFEDNVIISGVMTGWGENAIPAHRYVAFDKNTGAAVWLTSTKPRPEDTTYSSPVFATFNGQVAMVVGAGDGAIYAFQPRTGKVIWKYQASTRGINTSPLVDSEGIVYCGHGEQNFTDTTSLGAIFAFDGKREGEITDKDLLWKVKRKTIGKSSPLKFEDRVYFVEDAAALMMFEASTGKLIKMLDPETGKMVGQKKLGRSMFGSLVGGDGKIYAAESTGKFYTLKPSQSGIEIINMVQMPEGEEIFGSPTVSGGRIYLATTNALYCIGKPDAKPSGVPPREVFKEAPIGDETTVASIQLAPVELILLPGQKATYQVRAYNKRGQYLKLVKDAEISVQGGGTMGADLVYTAPSEEAISAVILTAKVGEMTSQARVRVVPRLPWKFDFNDGKVPPVWIGADLRHKAIDFEGEKVLVKVSTVPKGMRSQSWMGWPSFHDYTVKADFYATERNEKLPDMGLINQRYTLDLQGSKRLQMRSWNPRLELRFAKTMDFDWQANQWYTIKFESRNHEGGVTLRGKVWRRDDAEPTEWTMEATDGTPNSIGSPGMFGNATDSEFYIDNVEVVENPKS